MTHTPNARPAWRFSALWRRWLFLFLIFVPSILAASYMSALLPHGGGTLVELTLCILFEMLRRCCARSPASQPSHGLEHQVGVRQPRHQVTQLGTAGNRH